MLLHFQGQNHLSNIKLSQQVPPFLTMLGGIEEDMLASLEDDTGDERGCSYCGGLGHRITACPRLEAMQNKQAAGIGRKDYLAANAADY